MPRTLTADELTREFRKSVEDAIAEADYVTAEEAEAIINHELAKTDREDADEEDDLDFIDNGEPVEFTDEELEEALPSDIYEAVRAHLEGEEGKDPYLARQERDIDKAARAEQSEVERRMHARAQAVAEGETDVPLHEATGLYSDDEEGV